MNPEKMLIICRYGILISMLGLAIFTYGNSYYSNIVSELKNVQSNRDFKEEIVREIKNAIIEGSPEIVNKIPENQEWNFEQGTFEFILKEDVLFKNKKINMIVSSKDKNKILKIFKDENDFIEVTYKAPEIGTITRGVQIKKNEISSLAGKKGVYIAFIWNLNEHKTTLYINGKERDDLFPRSPGEEFKS